ncbi:hypothetical protein WN944_001749 [Citrus x changshan-huyou]|uniref:Cyclin C-terminal domain-containing protein n=1 Tax=Citrus x changshan-huyou TaxID=2935761 RepID=A0AAP0QV41_9ROSI
MGLILIKFLISVTDISFTSFKPSLSAASALLTACRLLTNEVYEENKKILSARKYVEEVLSHRRMHYRGSPCFFIL